MQSHFTSIVACDSLYKATSQPGTTSQLNTVYFDALGIPITADPIDSQQHIILTGAPTYVGQYKSVTTGSYRLTSFSFPSTLICLHPVFAEELRLLQEFDGNQSTAVRIVQNINYLRAKYCRLVHEILRSDGDALIKENCFQYTGMFRGERVFWGACDGQKPADTAQQSRQR
jgi:hypothetical protein